MPDRYGSHSCYRRALDSLSAMTRRSSTEAAYFMLITWENALMSRIRDFRNTRYVIRDAEVDGVKRTLPTFRIVVYTKSMSKGELK